MARSGDKETHAAGGDNKLAWQLLKPRRRAQIEVWLDETVSEQGTQYCTAGREFGHRSDLSIPQSTGQPGESHHSTSVIEGICPVCGRSSEGEQGQSKYPSPRLVEGKAKHMFRGIKSVVGHFRARDAGKSGSGGDDDEENKAPGRAMVTTAMFLAEASEDDSSVATVLSSSGRFGGGEGKALEERMARLMRAQKLLEKSQARRG